jgi:hypothetical protein
MSDTELELLRAKRPEVTAPTAEATTRARASLMTMAAGDLRSPASDSSRRRFVIRAATAAALAGAAAVVVIATVPGTSSAPAKLARLSAPSSQTVLARLADSVLASPPPAGDATLVIRSQVVNGAAPVLGADLYSDSGEYFYSPTESGLPAQVSADNNLGDGVFGREVAAAEQAATGDLAAAARAMEDAPLTPGTTPQAPSNPPISTPFSNVNRADNWLWSDSLDALSAGAGNPTVRAGVMRLLSTLPEVTVVNATVNGESVVTITAGFPALPTNYQEQLTIDASTGVPVSFVGGTIGQPPTVQVSYQVSRVSLAEVAKGDLAPIPAASTTTPSLGA